MKNVVYLVANPETGEVAQRANGTPMAYFNKAAAKALATKLDGHRWFMVNVRPSEQQIEEYNREQEK